MGYNRLSSKGSKRILKEILDALLRIEKYLLKKEKPKKQLLND